MEPTVLTNAVASPGRKGWVWHCVIAMISHFLSKIHLVGWREFKCIKQLKNTPTKHNSNNHSWLSGGMSLMGWGELVLKSTHKGKTEHRQITLKVLKIPHKLLFYKNSFVRKQQIHISLLMLAHLKNGWALPSKLKLFLLSFSPFLTYHTLVQAWVIIREGGGRRR